MHQKTLFITSFHPHISRNIFATDVLPLLKKEKKLRVIIICPDYKVDYFVSIFGGGNVFVEGVPLYLSSKKNRAGLFFKKLAFYSIPSETRWIKQRYKLFIDKKYSHFIFFVLVNFLGRSFAYRRLIRRLDLEFSPSDFFQPLIDKYKPNVIFSTDLHDENDVSFTQAAKKRGIPILGMFRSWDNPTQSILRIFPDKLLAGSKAISDEAVYWQGYPKEKISLVGHPHYDKYLKGATKTKEEFFREFGLDPGKKLILFTPLGDKFVRVNDIDQYAMESLAGIDAQILVRFPPDEQVTLKNFIKPESMVFHRPGFAFSNKFEDREIRREDDDSLINSIYWSDLVITGPTSINLDAAFFDKPVVAAHLVPPPVGGVVRNYFDTDYCFDFSHIRKVLATSGVEYVRTKEDLLSAVSECITNPSKNAEGRAKIRSVWFSHADGVSAFRLCEQVFDFLGMLK